MVFKYPSILLWHFQTMQLSQILYKIWLFLVLISYCWTWITLISKDILMPIIFLFRIWRQCKNKWLNKTCDNCCLIIPKLVPNTVLRNPVRQPMNQSLNANKLDEFWHAVVLMVNLRYIWWYFYPINSFIRIIKHQCWWSRIRKLSRFVLFVRKTMILNSKSFADLMVSDSSDYICCWWWRYFCWNKKNQ